MDALSTCQIGGVADISPLDPAVAGGVLLLPGWLRVAPVLPAYSNPWILPWIVLLLRSYLLASVEALHKSQLSSVHCWLPSLAPSATHACVQSAYDRPEREGNVSFVGLRPAPIELESVVGDYTSCGPPLLVGRTW